MKDKHVRLVLGVTPDVALAYEREAEARGGSVRDVYRDAIERAPWVSAHGGIKRSKLVPVGPITASVAQWAKLFGVTTDHLYLESRLYEGATREEQLARMLSERFVELLRLRETARQKRTLSVEEMRALRLGGATYEQIAEKAGISASVVQRALKSIIVGEVHDELAGYVRPKATGRGPHRRAALSNEEITSLFAEGVDLLEIARRAGITRGRVQQILDEELHGDTPRKGLARPATNADAMALIDQGNSVEEVARLLGGVAARWARRIENEKRKRAMRARIAEGATQATVAEEFGVSRQYVSLVLHEDDKNAEPGRNE